jgi:hypothetical protein
MEILIISPYKNIIFKKKPLKKTKSFKISQFNHSSQVQTQAKLPSFKNRCIKIDLLPGGKNLLSYYTL